MHPTIFGVPSYSIFLVTALLLGTLTPIALAFRKQGKHDLPAYLAIIAVCVAAVAGGKGYSIVERTGALSSLSTELFRGYRLPGAILGAAISLLFLQRTSRVSAWTIADLLAPGAALGVAVLRIGCFLAGCCAGTRCSLPWSVRFPEGSAVWFRHVRHGVIDLETPLSLPVHPLQLYFSLWSLLVGLFVIWLRRQHLSTGQVFLAYLFLASVGKYCLEFLRFARVPHVQYAALLCAVLSLMLILWRHHVASKSDEAFHQDA